MRAALKSSSLLIAALALACGGEIVQDIPDDEQPLLFPDPMEEEVLSPRPGGEATVKPVSCRAAEGTHAGDVVLRDDAHTAALAGVTRIEGDLVLSGGLTHLGSLDCLHTVEGSLFLQGTGQLKNLAGLEMLAEVEGNLEIVGNEALLTTSALGRLQHVGGDIVVERNDRLLDLEGVAGVARSLSGGLYVRDNDSLEELVGFHRLDVITGDFVLEGNPVLRSVSELSHRGRSPLVLGDLRVVENDSLISLELPMAGSQAMSGSVVVRDNPVLEAIYMHADSALHLRGSLELNGNPQLETFEGAELIEVVSGSVLLAENTSLGSLQMLRGLRAVTGELAVLGNERLPDLELPRLTAVGALTITRNLSLESLDGLGTLTRVAGPLEIMGNPALDPCHVEELEARIQGLRRVEDCSGR